MAQNSNIEWTDATWNCIRGCSRVSEGCRNCYAERVAMRFSGPGKPYEGLVKIANGHPQWTGKVKFVKEHLADPLKWKTPRRVFVNSMSDLFHDGLTVEQIDQVFAVMALCREHTFQVLTKRPARMLEYMLNIQNEDKDTHRWSGLACEISDSPCAAGVIEDLDWPPKNIWLGVSCENQATADERIPLLLQTPAAIRWVSAEPLLAPLDIEHYLAMTCRKWDTDPPNPIGCDGEKCPGRRLDWIVAGSESGPGARFAELDWFRSLRDQCVEARVPYFLKQFAERGKKIPLPMLDGKQWAQYPPEASRA